MREPVPQRLPERFDDPLDVLVLRGRHPNLVRMSAGVFVEGYASAARITTFTCWVFKAFPPAIVAPIVAGQLGPLADAVKNINARFAPLDAEANDCLQPISRRWARRPPLGNIFKGIAARLGVGAAAALLALTEHGLENIAHAMVSLDHAAWFHHPACPCRHRPWADLSWVAVSRDTTEMGTPTTLQNESPRSGDFAAGRGNAADGTAPVTDTPEIDIDDGIDIGW